MNIRQNIAAALAFIGCGLTVHAQPAQADGLSHPVLASALNSAALSKDAPAIVAVPVSVGIAASALSAMPVYGAAAGSHAVAAEIFSGEPRRLPLGPVNPDPNGDEPHQDD